MDTVINFVLSNIKLCVIPSGKLSESSSTLAFTASAVASAFASGERYIPITVDIAPL